MIGYILSPNMIKTVTPSVYPGLRPDTVTYKETLTPVKVDVLEYDLPLRAAQAETGKVVITGELTASAAYCFFIAPETFPGCYWMITTAESADGLTTTLNVVDFISAADGVVAQKSTYRTGAKTGFALASADATTGVMNGLYRRVPKMQELPYTPGATDPYFAFYTDLLDGLEPPLEEYVAEDSNNQYWDCGKVLRLLLANGVRIEPTLRGLEPGIEVSAAEPSEPVPVYFNDGHAEKVSESYETDVCSHVRWIYAASSAYGNTVGWYLCDDNTVTADQTNVGSHPPVNQKPGYTKTIFINKTYDKGLTEAYQAALAIFAQNKEAHKIEFWSDKEYSHGQRVTLMLSRGPLESQIHAIRAKSGDNRKLYVCGELPATLQDKISALSWGYGTRLPEAPKKGTLWLQP